MTAARRREMTFFLVAALLSVQAVGYRVAACFPPLPVAQNSPENLVHGLAVTPYQYRVLIPGIIRAALAAGLIGESQLQLAFVVIEAVTWFLVALVFRRFLRKFVADPGLSSAAALSIYFVLPFNYFDQAYFPYDVPSMLSDRIRSSDRNRQGHVYLGGYLARGACLARQDSGQVFGEGALGGPDSRYSDVCGRFRDRGPALR